MSGTTALGFVYPTTGDQMCAAAGISPAETAVQALADSVDAWVSSNLDADATRLAVVPRARVSKSNFDGGSNLVAGPTIPFNSFDTVEYNVATSTDLGIYQYGLILPAGTWMVMCEWRIGITSALSEVWIQSITPPQTTPSDEFLQMGLLTSLTLGDLSVLGGGLSTSQLMHVNVSTQVTVGVNMLGSGNIRYTYDYLALSAFKIADYF